MMRMHSERSFSSGANWLFARAVLFTFLIVFVLAGPLVEVLLPFHALAQDIDDEDNEDAGLFDDGDDEGLSLEEAGAADEGKDFEFLRSSHLSLVGEWINVRPLRKPRDGWPQETYHWAPNRKGISPLGNQPAHTFVSIPAEGSYRVYLRHELTTTRPRPVTLSLTPQKAAQLPTEKAGDPPRFKFTDAGPAHSHVFGKPTFLPAMSGKRQEKKLPVRFESEPQLIGFPDRPAFVWEYWDVKLSKGPLKLALQSDVRQVKVHSVFLSQSKDFRPSFTDYGDDRTFDRVYLRFRVLAGKVQGETYNVSSGLTYHWRGRNIKKTNKPMWGYQMGGLEGIPAKGWSPFLDGTDALVPGPGPWSTCRLSFGGLKKGEVEIQAAWYLHEGAVQHTTKVLVGGGRAMLRLPHGVPRVHSQPLAAAWGMWPKGYVSRIRPEAEIIEHYFTWAREAEKKLNLPPGHPRTRNIRLFSGCRVGQANQARVCEMLALLGINWIDGAPPEIVEKYNLHVGKSGYNTDNADRAASGLSAEERKIYVKHKIGDEIGTYTGANAVNKNSRKRRSFHAYLEARAKFEGMDKLKFLGLRSCTPIDMIDALPENPGRYERRLFYCSQRYAHIATIPDYKVPTEKFHRYFPNVNVYNNYSPHPLFLTGTTMNHSDWFILCRNQAQTMGWAEDWATGGGWGLGTTYQCTTYYAALVECAARKHGYPSGFYVGVNCGGGARKILSCVGQGLTWLHLYDWGPIDGWAEGSNAWSEMQSQYYAVLAAASALGPADKIIGKGQREPRRTAILYNRSHEIWNGGMGRANHDWMWTYIGLRSAQIPVDVIIEEDLNPDDLKRYKVIYLGGLNLARRHVAALHAWVEGGGLLVGTAGAAMRDIYNDIMPETIRLFGASQTLVPQPVRKRGKKPPPSPRVTFTASDYLPQADFIAEGLQCKLTPERAEVVGTFDDGSPAAVTRTLGEGRCLLFGFQPGFAYRKAEKWTKQPARSVRKWLVAPALRHLGRQTAEYSDPDSEVTVFTHKTGMAVMLASFSWAQPESTRLSVRVGKQVKQVSSSLNGPLKWTEKDGRLEVTVPQLKPVDVIMFSF